MLSIQLTFAAEVFDAFRCLQIGGMRAGLLHQPLQYLRILQHGAGPQMIFIEGLVVVIRHEQRLLQAVQKAHIIYVRAGIMDEHAGLHVARRVDVTVILTARYTAGNKLAVILEVDGK